MAGLICLLISLLLIGIIDSHPTCASPPSWQDWDDRSTISTVYEFPSATWIENIAVRTNGQLLVTEDTKPRVYLVDPVRPTTAYLVHEFSTTASVLGIAEGAQDVFYICTANYSSKLLQGYGQGYIYKIDMRGFSTTLPNSAQVSEVAYIPEAGALDGLVYFSGVRDLLYSSDFLNGVIWSINPSTGDYDVFINNTYTQSTGFGVNGLRLLNGNMYFTNSQRQALIEVSLDSQGQVNGDFSIIAQGDWTPDDFALDKQGNAYITTFTSAIAGDTVGSDGVFFAAKNGTPGSYVALVAGPTAAAFGRTRRDQDVLYITTSGGDNDYLTGKPITVGGKIFALKTTELRAHHQ